MNGIKISVTKAGNDSVISLKLIFATAEIMNKPTIISAGDVADAGTIKNSGAKNRANKNIKAVLTEVNPVRPPAATPDELSTYAVIGLVPRTAPIVVPKASANRAFFYLRKITITIC